MSDIDYSKTVNLLQTAFPMKADLPKREPDMLARWETERLYERVLRKQDGKPVFLLHDGPPYANGAIHMGHALNKVLKDFVVKYKTFQGYQCPYKPGWDCHGLPIEHQLFKQLKKSKSDVDRNDLRRQATDYALGFVGSQREDFKRLGVFGAWDDPYLTLSKDYEAATVEVFFDLRRSGFVYRNRKPGYWCAFDETALAEAEVEYADKKSDSVFVRFAIDAESIPEALEAKIPAENAFVLIWTTTPWTLPANMALAFHPDEAYLVMEKDGAFYIVAEKRQGDVAGKIGGGTVLEDRFFGRDAVGLRAANPLHGRVSRVVTAPYVTMEDGTGIVHIAPGHGLEDFDVGLKWGLEVISPVDERGLFDENVGCNELVGKHVLKDANAAVMETLGDALVFSQAFRHSYPHCWRCKNPIIFRATEQWFLRVDDGLRRKLLDEIDVVKWEPAYGIHRIKGMVEQRPDWCLSRQRHWGTPIAVLFCEGCGEPVNNEKLDRKIVDLIREEGGDGWYAKAPADIAAGTGAACERCKGTSFRKEMDILDVWFDSGVSWHAVIDRRFADPKPLAVMYLEGSDQHRGWFQTSLIPSVALRKKAPYDVVMTHGFVVDGKGRKMSKSLGNVMAPQEIIGKFGADVLRLWVAMSDYREDVRLSQDILKHVIDVYRRFRNLFRFFLQNTADFRYSENARRFDDLAEIDRWILVHFEEVKSRVLDAYEKYEFHVVLSELNRFAAVELSGFYLDVLKDRLYCDLPDAPSRRSAQTSFHHLARGLSLLLAPLLSFTAEEAYGELRRVSNPALPPSVFLDDYESLEDVALDRSLSEKWNAILDIRGRINDILDRERKVGRIKSSQEAAVAIKAGSLPQAIGEALMESDEDWAFLFQMAEVAISPDSAPDDEAVAIRPTEFEKCERCWRHRPDVGTAARHPRICARCAEAVEQMSVGAE